MILSAESQQGSINSSVVAVQLHEAIGGPLPPLSTLYLDVIESASFTGGPSLTDKSHHNVRGLPAHMKMKLVEPLRELFKEG